MAQIQCTFPSVYFPREFWFECYLDGQCVPGAPEDSDTTNVFISDSGPAQANQLQGIFRSVCNSHNIQFMVYFPISFWWCLNYSYMWKIHIFFLIFLVSFGKRLMSPKEHHDRSRNYSFKQFLLKILLLRIINFMVKNMKYRESL